MTKTLAGWMKKSNHWLRGNDFYRSHRKSINFDYTTIDAMALDVSNSISVSKTKYFDRLAINLEDCQSAPKTDRSIFKTFVNGTKIPNIWPLLENNKLITKFKLKADLFNNFLISNVLQ